MSHFDFRHAIWLLPIIVVAVVFGLVAKCST